MKKITLFFILVSLTGYAQHWSWARKADATASGESVSQIRSDNAGNVYLFGATNGGSKYGNTTLASGSFLVKFDPQGTVLWAQNVIFSGNGYYTSEMNVDGAGNIYFVGRFYNNLSVFSYSFVGHGEEDIYLIKLDPMGTPLWSKTFGGQHADVPASILIDKQQNIYIDGAFNTSVSFGSQELAAEGDHFFLVKLDPSGTALWATSGDSTFTSGGVMRADKYNNLYVTGYRYYGSFMSKFDELGNLQWVKDVWGMYDYAADFQVSNAGNIFLLHNGNGHYSYLPILVKYDSLMNAQWSRAIGTYYGCYQMDAGIFIDSTENSYVAGIIGTEFCHQDSVYFLDELAHVGYSGVPAIAKFSTSGDLTWVKTGASTDYDGIHAMTQDKKGGLYAAGKFNYPSVAGYGDTLTFDNSMLVNDGSWQQIFLAKLDPSSPGTMVTDQLSPDNSFVLFPNPSAGVFSMRATKVKGVARLTVYDLSGNCLLSKECMDVNEEQIDLRPHPAGIYFVELQAGDSRIVRKVSKE